MGGTGIWGFPGAAYSWLSFCHQSLADAAGICSHSGAVQAPFATTDAAARASAGTSRFPGLLTFPLPVPLDEPLLPLPRSDLGSPISGISLVKRPWPEFTRIQTSPKSLESRNHSKD